MLRKRKGRAAVLVAGIDINLSVEQHRDNLRLETLIGVVGEAPPLNFMVPAPHALTITVAELRRKVDRDGEVTIVTV